MLHSHSDCTTTTVYDTATTVPAGFIDSLVQANLQPVMQALEDIDAFLVSLRPAIVRIASNFYHGYQPRDTEIDDLIQEGMIAAWKATTTFDASKVTGSSKSYYLTAARYAMLDFIKRHSNTSAIGMEDTAWLMVPARQAEASREYTTSERQHINKAMRKAKLSRRQRYAVRAELQYHHITMPGGGRAQITRHSLQKRLKLSNSGYESLLWRASKKLTSLQPVTI